MAVTVAKAVYNSTEVEFYDNEAETIQRDFLRGYDLYQLENQRFGLYYTDKGYNLITVNFRIKYGPYETNSEATLAKIDTLYDWIDSNGHPEKFKLYYKMLWDSDEWIWVQMFREEMEWRYLGGDEQAEHLIPLRFIQTTFGSPGVVYKILAGTG